MAVFSAR